MKTEIGIKNTLKEKEEEFSNLAKHYHNCLDSRERLKDYQKLQKLYIQIEILKWAME